MQQAGDYGGEKAHEAAQSSPGFRITAAEDSAQHDAEKYGRSEGSDHADEGLDFRRATDEQIYHCAQEPNSQGTPGHEAPPPYPASNSGQEE